VEHNLVMKMCKGLEQLLYKRQKAAVIRPGKEKAQEDLTLCTLSAGGGYKEGGAQEVLFKLKPF